MMMTTTEAAKAMRTMTEAERVWVRNLVENKSVAYTDAVPYVLQFRDAKYR